MRLSVVLLLLVSVALSQRTLNQVLSTDVDKLPVCDKFDELVETYMQWGRLVGRDVGEIRGDIQILEKSKIKMLEVQPFLKEIAKEFKQAKLLAIKNKQSDAFKDLQMPTMVEVQRNEHINILIQTLDAFNNTPLKSRTQKIMALMEEMNQPKDNLTPAERSQVQVKLCDLIITKLDNIIGEFEHVLEKQDDIKSEIEQKLNQLNALHEECGGHNSDVESQDTPSAQPSVGASDSSVGEYYSEYTAEEEDSQSQNQSGSSQATTDSESSVDTQSDSDSESESQYSEESSTESSESIDYPKPPSLEESTPEEASSWSGDSSESVGDQVINIPAKDSTDSDSEEQANQSENSQDSQVHSSGESQSPSQGSEQEDHSVNEYEHEETSDEVYSDGMNFKGINESSAEPSSEWKQSETELSEQIIHIPAESTSDAAPELVFIEESPWDIDLATIEAEAIAISDWDQDSSEDMTAPSFITLQSNPQYQRVHQRRAERLFKKQARTRQFIHTKNALAQMGRIGHYKRNLRNAF